MERANTQVLRLSCWRNEDILWANGNTILPLDQVPVCENCGCQRKFEFQIMPQLIYLLGQETGAKNEYPEIDFGSLIVFTCCETCTHILKACLATRWVECTHRGEGKRKAQPWESLGPGY